MPLSNHPSPPATARRHRSLDIEFSKHHHPRANLKQQLRRPQDSYTMATPTPTEPTKSLFDHLRAWGSKSSPATSIANISLRIVKHEISHQATTNDSQPTPSRQVSSQPSSPPFTHDLFSLSPYFSSRPRFSSPRTSTSRATRPAAQA